MNTVIFITKENKAEMTEAIKRLAAAQDVKINGALVVCHQSVVSTKEAEKIARPLIEKFATGAAIKTSSNLNISHDGQVAMMFAKFVTLGYSRYPGAWLIIDSPMAPVCRDWMTRIAKQHAIHGGKITGHAKQDGKTILTYGPLTMQIPNKVVKMLSFSTSESWRSRGRYLLAGAGLRVISDEEAVLLPLDKAPVVKAPDPEPVTPEMILAADEKVEKDQLMDKLEKATGKRPHHFTGIDKLREMVQSLPQPQTV